MPSAVRSLIGRETRRRYRRREKSRQQWQWQQQTPGGVREENCLRKEGEKMTGHNFRSLGNLGLQGPPRMTMRNASVRQVPRTRSLIRPAAHAARKPDRQTRPYRRKPKPDETSPVWLSSFVHTMDAVNVIWTSDSGDTSAYLKTRRERGAIKVNIISAISSENTRCQLLCRSA